MKLFFKFLFLFALTAILLFAFVAIFSSKSSSYECVGEMTNGDNLSPSTIYIQLEEYRWWVGLWSDSDGNLKLEIPRRFNEFYEHIVDIDIQLQIYSKPQEMKGYFSPLSKVLSVKTTLGFFDGKCKRIDR